MDRFMRARRVKYLPAKQRLSGLTDLHDDGDELERLGYKFERAINTLCSQIRSRSTHYRRKRSLNRFQRAYENVDKTLLVFLVARWGSYILDIISEQLWAEFGDHYRSLLKNYPRLPDVGRAICEKYKDNIENLLNTAAKLSEVEAEDQKHSEQLSSTKPWSKSPLPDSSKESSQNQGAQGAHICPDPSLSDVLSSDQTAIAALDASSPKAARTKTLDLRPPKPAPAITTPALQGSNRSSEMLGPYLQVQQPTSTVAACMGDGFGFPMVMPLQSEDTVSFVNPVQQQNLVQQSSGFLHTPSEETYGQQTPLDQPSNMTQRGNFNVASGSMSFQLQENQMMFPLLKMMLILSGTATETVVEANDDGFSISKVHLLNNGQVVGIIEVSPVLSTVITEHTYPHYR
ncbi:hypothetical protein ABEF92_005106 [Exophiala dermatitidis]|uniref:Uncharacterized protein n=1 Tax=Exophiala dermatitidis (strain ATCC 34100 / CBS 525.76 / NIH/UT8656) TaxID=858893 RepID=H6CAY1_EXODN|nr:uncharacterized protein HMPREF1120_08871 [Exophiala dermatitidis NIH/UT8656]EHY60928.1 hypothetical protein HMPREF1120_08871 [Exophiala dermatitidis NIH/UT8656]